MAGVNEEKKHAATSIKTKVTKVSTKLPLKDQRK